LGNKRRERKRIMKEGEREGAAVHPEKSALILYIVHPYFTKAAQLVTASASD